MTTASSPLAGNELKKCLQNEFVGKTFAEVPTPAAVLDLSIVRRNCSRMLEAVDALGFGWRAHIKTHKYLFKIPSVQYPSYQAYFEVSLQPSRALNDNNSQTAELTKLQVGDGTRPANLVVSTIAEAENITPLLLGMKKTGRAVNILYGFPLPPSGVSRLVAVSKTLGPGGLSLLVDHPDQIHSVYKLRDESGIAPQIYLKVDMGYGRAGVLPQSQAASQLISDILSAEEVGAAVFCGLYSHGGNSYYGNNIASAIDILRQEFEALFVIADEVKSSSPSKKLILSVGATPTATSLRNLLLQESTMTTDEKTAAHALRAAIAAVKKLGCEVELHAGVYTVLDTQQLATRALPTTGPHQMLSWSDLGLTILAEVVSIYPGRGRDGSPEVLIAAGSLAMGREPCKAYSGWGIVSPWNIEKARMPDFGPDMHQGWQVGRISQEHGILTWHGACEESVSPPTIGQKIRIWPNHACIAGAGFDWYLVIDSEGNVEENTIVDVWPRWRGW